MRVRFFPGTKKRKSSLVEGFLSEFKVDHELAYGEKYAVYTHLLGKNPAVEVDGRLFVDPNVDALKKILDVK